MGNVKEHEALEEIWSDSLKECKTRLNRITFEDFKGMMKGQPKEAQPMRACSSEPTLPLEAVIEGGSGELKRNPFHSSPELDNLDHPNDKRHAYGMKRSHSHTIQATMWDSSTDLEPEIAPAPSTASGWFSALFSTPSRAAADDASAAGRDGLRIAPSASSTIGANRALYRRHREIRVSVLEASKQFDKKRAERRTENTDKSSSNNSSTSNGVPPDHRGASLIMRRGAQAPIELEDAHQRALFEAAARRCGRMRRERNKTKSDVTGMLLKAGVVPGTVDDSTSSPTAAEPP
jgi:hypothetical protein